MGPPIGVQLGPKGGTARLADVGELLLPSDAVPDSYWVNWYLVEPRFTPGLRRYHPIDRPIQVEAYGVDGNAHSLSLKTPATVRLKLDRPEIPKSVLEKPALRQLTPDGWQPVSSSYDPVSKTLSAEITSLPVTLMAVDSSQPVAASVPDPSDPAAVQLDGGAWGMAAVDGSGNLAFWRGQGYPTRWLDPMVVEYSANTPALLRIGGTLALFYAKATGGVKQVFLRTSTDNGTSWSTPSQLTSEAVNVYQIQASSYDGTTYLFWSRQDSSTLLQYRTSTDLAGWSAPATVGQPIGILASRITPTFDIKRLNSGAWGLSWLDYHPEEPGWADYDGIFLATSPDLSSTAWSNKQVLNPSAVGDRWPAEMSVGQTASGTIYVSFSMYDYPWDNYMFYRTSDDDGATWGPRVVYGYEPSRTPDGWQMVGSHNSYLALDSYGNLRSFWDQSAYNLYPTQLFRRDLPSGPITPISTGSVVVQPAPADAPYLLPSHTVTTSRDPVITLTGSYSYSHTDLAISGRGPSPVFTRAYNSGDTRVGVLGPGWTHSYEIRLVDPGEWNGALLLVGSQGRADRYTRNADGSYTPPAGSYTALVKNADNSYTATHKDGTVWSFDSAGRLSGIADRYGNRSTLTYNADGQLTSVGDPSGRGSLALTYDPATGRLASVSDWASPARTIQYGYDSSGRLQTVTDREGKVTTFAYDSTSSRLTTITDANNHTVVTMTYDGSGRVQTQKDARGLATGQQTTFGYVANADGSKTTTVTYPATSLDPTWNPQVIDYYDAQGRLIKRISKPTSNSAEDVVEERGYDANSNVIWIKDGRGNLTDLAYDVDYAGQPIPGSRGNLTRRIDPAPSAGQPRPVTLYRYDSKDNLIQVIPPRGVASDANASPITDFSAAIDLTYATDMAYDATGAQLESVTRRYTDPDLGQQTAVTKYEYGDAANPGLITKVIPPRGNTGPTPDYSYATTMTYFGSGSEAGLLESTTDPLGNVTTYEYDAVGRRVGMVDPNGNAPGASPRDHSWAYGYDNEDRVRFTMAPAPEVTGSRPVTEFRYDPVGNRTVVIDANGQVTKYLYDERDSLKEVQQSPNPWTDPNTAPDPEIVTQYQYDNAGNLSRVLRASGDAGNERATDYAYDGLNRVRKETQYPQWPSTTPSLLTQYSYDLAGNRTGLIDPLSQTTTFGYENLNRLVSVGYSDGQTPNVSYSYDANGNRSTMADGTGTTSYSYDEMDRLLSVTSPGPKTVGYRYDLDGNRTKVIYPDSAAVTYSFDRGSRLESLLDWASRAVGYQYNPDGSLKETANFNGTTTGYSYDNALRLTDLWNQKGTDTVSRHSYTLDAVGNRLKADELLPSAVGGTASAPLSTQPAVVTSAAVTESPSAADLSVNVSEGAAGASPGRAKGQSVLPGRHRLLMPSVSGSAPSATSEDGVEGALAQGDNVAILPPAAPVGAPRQPRQQTSPLLKQGQLAPDQTSTAMVAATAASAQGSSVAWGDDWFGQLGDGTTTNRAAPLQVTSVAGVSRVAGGSDHSLAVKSDGTVWAWGSNGSGQLGAGTAAQQSVPIQVTGLEGVTTAAGGGWHSLAVKGDGTVWAWGWNGNGQLGDGTTSQRNSPVQVAGLTGVIAVAGGGWHSLALKSDGTVWAWGWNGAGQLGDGSTTDRYTPVQVTGLSGVTSIAAGVYHSLALRNDGTVWAWGWNANGQLGDGTTAQRKTPVQVSGVSGVSGISAGAWHSLATKGDQTAWAWGWNGDGQLGDGSTTDRASPVQVAGLTGVVAVAGAQWHSLALRSDGTVWAWGWNGYGQLSIGSRNSHYTPVQVGGLGLVSGIATGFYHNLVLQGDGTLWAWGDDYWGELGDGTTTKRSVASPVGAMSGVTAIAAGGWHSLALKNDGTAWGWGGNWAGQLADGTTTDRYLPVQVSGLSDLVAIVAGAYHSLAARADGTVWAWGASQYGQLGDGTTSNRSLPVRSGTLTGVAAVAAGGWHSLAVRNDGTVWGWGYNLYGQLGDGSTTDRYIPTQVTGLGGAKAVAAGFYHSLALKDDGTVWAWGSNTAGQLGDGSTTNRSTPVQVSGISGVVAIAAAGNFSLALRNDGTVWAWGGNLDGQLGDGTTTNRPTPVQVSGLTGVTAIAAGGYHSLAVKNDGTVWSWGLNDWGELGLGSIREQHITPTQVVGAGGMTVVAAGLYHSLAANAISRTATTIYGYDRLYRLTSVDAPSGPTSYVYDPAGNRSSMTQGTQTGYSYDRADRITSAGTVSYTVDANGNLVARGADSFGYDQANRLRSATVGSTSATYAYDGDGKRASKTVGAATTSYVYDVNASLPVLLDDGTRKYVWGLGLAFAVDTSGNPIVYHTDGLGSVRALTDTSGNVVQTYRYDEYGNLASSQGSVDQPFRYTGEQYDPETGLVYLRARMYDPGSGRFIGRDPAPGVVEEPSTLSRYTYAYQNPILLTDPSGQTVTVGKNSILRDPLMLAATTSNNPVGPLVAAVSMAAARVAPQVSQQLGIQGEKLADIVKNTVRIESVTGTAKYRVPDILDETAKIIGDVKNVAYLANRSQLKDFVEYAKANDFTMILKVRENTTLSSSLQRLVDDGIITLQRVIP